MKKNNIKILSTIFVHVTINEKLYKQMIDYIIQGVLLRNWNNRAVKSLRLFRKMEGV